MIKSLLQIVISDFRRASHCANLLVNIWLLCWWVEPGDENRVNTISLRLARANRLFDEGLNLRKHGGRIGKKCRAQNKNNYCGARLVSLRLRDTLLRNYNEPTNKQRRESVVGENLGQDESPKRRQAINLSLFKCKVHYWIRRALQAGLVALLKSHMKTRHYCVIEWYHSVLTTIQCVQISWQGFLQVGCLLPLFVLVVGGHWLATVSAGAYSNFAVGTLWWGENTLLHFSLSCFWENLKQLTQTSRYFQWRNT